MRCEGYDRAIPHNSKCRYGERGAAHRAAARRFGAQPTLCGGSWRGDPPERCLSRQAGIVRCYLNYTAFISALQAHRRRKGRKKIPPPDTGSGAFLNESNFSGICARSMRCGLLYCVFSRRAARISFWIAGVVSIFCINAASSSGSCFAGSCSATTAARYSAWDMAGSKVRA